MEPTTLLYVVMKQKSTIYGVWDHRRSSAGVLDVGKDPKNSEMNGHLSKEEIEY